MKLKEIIKVNNEFQRSINIAYDKNNVDCIEGYVCTTTTDEILLNLSLQRLESNQHAYTWTGPYGSGKSLLALLLMNLITKDERTRKIASEKISQSTYEIINRAFLDNSNKFWTILPVVGEKDAPEKIIEAAFRKTNLNVPLTKNNIIDTIEEIISKEKLILIFDEVGKVLEYAADGGCDIYLFQQLAELANRSKNFVFICILHQSFSEYSRSLPFNMRDEWSKIQGRFIDYAINTAGQDQINLIGKAILKTSNDYLSENFKKTCIETAINISNNREINISIYTNLLESCWPLNPIVTCLLSGLSRKKFGQNQRSIFSFLNSSEQFAFIDFITHTDLEAKYQYSVKEFYNYLQINFESLISTSIDSKFWNLGLENIQRATVKGADEKTCDIIKLITLCDIFKSISGISPTLDIISIGTGLAPSDVVLRIKQLESLSLIIFKKHLGCYGLFEGSDFNIDESLANASFKKPPIKTISLLSNIVNLQPVIGKRHYHETGAIRWFSMNLATLDDLKSSQKIENQSEIGEFYIIIPKNNTELGQVNQVIEKLAFKSVYCIINKYKLINDYLDEITSLEWIQSNDQQLLSDAIARREVESRLFFLKRDLVSNLESELFEKNWKFNGKDIDLKGQSSLSSYVSNSASNQFPYAPKIHSELLNKDKPSGSAMSACSALIMAMFCGHGSDRLGIEGYPPEGGLFEILVENTGIYNGTKFVYPPEGSTFYALWKLTDEYLKVRSMNIPLPILFEYWQKILGVKSGLHNFLATAYLLTNQDKIAVYIQGVYTADSNSYLADFLARTPKYIEYRWIDTSNSNQTYLNELYEIISKHITYDPKQSKILDIPTPLLVAKCLVSFLDNLNHWILRTKRFQNSTMRLRDKVKNAHDPNQLIFNDIPEIFLNSKQSNWLGDLDSSLNELKNAYNELLIEFKDYILTDFSDNYSDDAFTAISSEATKIKGKSGDFRLDSFITRLTSLDRDSLNTIEALMSFSINKPISNWIDLDIERSKLSLSELISQYKKTVALVEKSSRNENSISIMLSKKGNQIIYNVDMNSPKKQEIDMIKSTILASNIIDYDTSSLIIALSEICGQLISERQIIGEINES